MKILVVSLLRLGDLIQQKPLLKALHSKYAQAEVHLLVNKQFLSIEQLLGDEVAKVHAFDRELLQRSMGESSFNLFTCLDLLEASIAEINDEKFDLVLNWTHNRLSAYLLGTFDIPQKLGLNAREGRIQGLDSAWLRYFNDNFSGNYKSYFHYVELLGRAFELPVEKYRVRAPSADTQHNSSATVYFQCLTSDVKKNWPLEQFRTLKNKINEFRPDLKIQVLCSAGEKLALLKFFAEEDLRVCDLVEARELLRNSRLLISTDTSIKHLAAEVGTPILEIALGGSDAAKTAAFVENHLVVQGQSACYPCVHSQSCNQKSHLCAESVTVDRVLAKALELLQNAGENRPDSMIEVERTIWQAYLDQSEINSPIAISQAQDLVNRTEILEGYQQSFESCENFNEIFATLQLIREKGLDTGSYFQKLSQVFSDRFASAENAFQALKKALEQSRALLNLRKKLIETTLSPAGGTHAERT